MERKIVNMSDHRKKRRPPRRRRVIPRFRRALLVVAVVAGVIIALNAEVPGTLRDVFPRPGAGSSSVAGEVTRVRDGDTIVVGGTPVRIANLDCAEMDTAQGRQAREAMLQIARSGPMTCQLEGRMSYDREVGTCSVAGGGDIGETMIASGMCGRW